MEDRQRSVRWWVIQQTLENGSATKDELCTYFIALEKQFMHAWKAGYKETEDADKHQVDPLEPALLSTPEYLLTELSLRHINTMLVYSTYMYKTIL